MRFAVPLLALVCTTFLTSAASPALAQGGDVASMFARADLNHDGVVTRAEFAATRALRFRALDRNHDGYLNREDIPPIAALLRPDAERMLEALASFDTNHDGRISLAEFTAGSMRLFDEADTNHVGVLTKAEAKTAVERIRAELHLNPKPKR